MYWSMSSDTKERKRDGQSVTIDNQRLEAENARLLQILQSTPAAVISAQLDGTIETWNRGAETIYGYTASEAEGKNLSMLFPKDRLSDLAHILEKIRSGAPIEPFDTERVKKDGKLIALSITLSPLKDEAGSITGLASIAQDITHLKSVEAERARLQQIVESTSDFIGMCTNDEHITYINKAGRLMLGMAADEDVTGLSIYDFFPAWAGKMTKEVIVPAVRQNSLWQGETVLLARDGRQIPVSQVAMCHRSASGEIDFLSTIFRDISASKKLEEERLAFTQQLEKRVKERTAQLQLAVDELEAFSYSVSHDLRAPLRSVSRFSKILLDEYNEVLDATGQDYLARINRAGEVMSGLIDDLLELSCINRVIPMCKNVDLTSIATAIIDELQRSNADRRVDFSIEPDLNVTGDQHLLQILLDNLLRNAWKFTSKRECAHISVSSQIANGETVVCVSDDGAGFDMKYADRLFKPFQRLHSAEEFPGSGIGLAICRRIVSRLNGTIWAEGVPEQGAKIFFKLDGEN